jgi:cytochrome c oxidase cbb3-type subunit III
MRQAQTIAAFLFAAPWVVLSWQAPGSGPRPKERPGDLQRALAKVGRDAFQSRCAACHGLNGRGGEHAPDIVANPAVRRLTDRALYRIISEGIIPAGMPAFRPLLTSDEIKAVVAYVRSANGTIPASHLPGNAGRGAALFFGRAGCGECHMIAGGGGFLASDLTDYGRDHSPPEIRDAIVHPTADTPPGAATVTVTTQDGRQWTGMARNEDNFSIQLLDAKGVFHLFQKSDLASLKHEPRSLMPGDYGTRLKKAELDDLVSFLVGAHR